MALSSATDLLWLLFDRAARLAYTFSCWRLAECLLRLFAARGALRLTAKVQFQIDKAAATDVCCVWAKRDQGSVAGVRVLQNPHPSVQIRPSPLKYKQMLANASKWQQRVCFSRPFCFNSTERQPIRWHGALAADANVARVYPSAGGVMRSGILNRQGYC